MQNILAFFASVFAIFNFNNTSVITPVPTSDNLNRILPTITQRYDPTPTPTTTPLVRNQLSTDQCIEFLSAALKKGNNVDAITQFLSTKGYTDCESLLLKTIAKAKSSNNSNSSLTNQPSINNIEQEPYYIPTPKITFWPTPTPIRYRAYELTPTSLININGNAGSYSRYGNTTYGSDGSTYSQYGNTVYGNDGSTYSQYGNTIYGNDGSTYSTYGNTTYGNDGSTYTQYGNTTYGNDGSTCSIYGNTTYCN